jgi:hypothetical protein
MLKPVHTTGQIMLLAEAKNENFEAFIHGVTSWIEVWMVGGEADKAIPDTDVRTKTAFCQVKNGL